MWRLARGSSMAIALTLLRLGVSDRRLWLYDTFGSMPLQASTTVTMQVGNGCRRTHDVNISSHTPGLSSIRGMAGDGLDRISTGTRHVCRGPGGRTIARSARSGSLCSGSTLTGTSRRVTSSSNSTPARAWRPPARRRLRSLRRRAQGGRRYFAADPVLLSRIDYTGRMGGQDRSRPLSVEIFSLNSLARAFTVRSGLSLSAAPSRPTAHPSRDDRRPRRTTPAPVVQVERPDLRTTIRCSEALDRSALQSIPMRWVHAIDPARSP